MNPLLEKLALETFAWHISQYAEIEKRALAPIKWAAAQEKEKPGTKRVSKRNTERVAVEGS
ncbi:hypothetical protein P4H66_08415 [Paenibacillus dokdonensis]|uniref:Transposase n=1 Tax=Paenibacillus dokdonensis TaxID=2567944 RepID=A0ABU6GMD4_9BACL|nr:hypothetical protein [Paenibacillus dokdonensis]MEC0239875.1 hypothetical protein [Paenibacillus dokdonensis]